MSKKEKKDKKFDARQYSGNIKKLARVLGISVLIVLILVAVVYFADQQFHLFGSSRPSDSSSESLFYATDADNIRSISAYDNGLAVLSNSELMYFDTGGREINVNQHIFASPEMKINGKTLLLFDKGGTGYRIEKNASVYKEGTAPGIITCAAIGKTSNYAFSVDDDDGYQSHIFVYSANGKLQFEWGSASDYCLNIALSDSGNKIALCVVGVDNAEYFSKVLLFNFNSDAPAYTVDFSGKTVYHIDFISGRKIAVFTDGGVYTIDAEGKSDPVQVFSSTEITHSYISTAGLRCTVISPFGNDQAPLLSVFDEKNKLLFQRSYKQAVTGVICNGNYTAVLMGDHVEIVSRDNKVSGGIFPGETCEQYAIVNHSLYLLTGRGIFKYNLYFDTEKAGVSGTYSIPVEKGGRVGVNGATTQENEDAVSDVGPSVTTDTSAAPEDNAAPGDTDQEEDNVDNDYDDYDYDYDDGYDDYDDYYDNDYDYDDYDEYEDPDVPMYG